VVASGGRFEEEGSPQGLFQKKFGPTVKKTNRKGKGERRKAVVIAPLQDAGHWEEGQPRRVAPHVGPWGL